MSNLPIIIGGLAIGFFFLSKKKPTNTNKSEPNQNDSDSSKGDSPKGYSITDCSVLNITDPTTAFEYAYNLGKTISAGKQKLPEDILFAGMKNGQIVNCLTTKESYKTLLNTTEKANFVFEMFKFHYSGLASKQTAPAYLENLLQVRNIFKNFGFDVSKMKVELIEDF